MDTIVLARAIGGARAEDSFARDGDGENVSVEFRKSDKTATLANFRPVLTFASAGSAASASLSCSMSDHGCLWKRGVIAHFKCHGCEEPRTRRFSCSQGT